jgi:hypothetical protein
MRKRVRRKNVRVTKRRQLEPADLEDTFDAPELEEWMVAGGGK